MEFLEFIISNYIIFVVAAIVLLLGLVGYMMDKKKYNDYRQEILNEGTAVETMAAQPSNISEVATPISVSTDSIVPEAAPTPEMAPPVLDMNQNTDN